MLTDIINAAYFQAVRAAFQDFYLSFSGVHVEVVVFKEHVIGFVYDFHASCIGLCPDGEFIAGNTFQLTLPFPTIQYYQVFALFSIKYYQVLFGTQKTK